jgi:hypothetical protein
MFPFYIQWQDADESDDDGYILIYDSNRGEGRGWGGSLYSPHTQNFDFYE